MKNNDCPNCGDEHGGLMVNRYWEDGRVVEVCAMGDRAQRSHPTTKFEEVGKMTKRELMQEYSALCDAMHMKIDGVNDNSTKSDIQNAIDCLKCPEELLADYLTVIRLKYPNTYRTIMNAGDYRRHRFNRLYVYNTARHTLA